MVYLGGISLHDLFCLPIGNTLSPYCMTSVELLSVITTGTGSLSDGIIPFENWSPQVSAQLRGVHALLPTVPTEYELN